MSFQFVENVTLYIPDVKQSFTSFSESSNDNKLIVEIAAIHEGLTSNFNMYTAGQLENSLASWVQPYPRPVILNHDVYSDPIGRVMAAKMDKEVDGTPFVRLQAAITNPEAIQRVLDNRYLTGSVGGKADAAMCSICGTNWAESAMQAPACKHQRGQVYNGKLAYFELNGLSFKEYSFVNVPADPKSGIRNPITATTLGPLGAEGNEEDRWVRPVKFFALDMNKESVMELNESGDNTEVLSSMKKKQAHFTYMNLKGTFLSTTAHDFSEKDEEIFTFMQSYTTIDKEPNENAVFTNTVQESTPAEESNMIEKDASESVEDILKITEQLSADLASMSDDQVSAENDEALDENESSSEELLEDSSEEADLEDNSEDSLEESATKEGLIESLRVCLANTVSVYHEAHGFHWNVKGPDFSEYHDLFGSVYTDLYGSVDPLAESILKLGVDSPFRMSELAGLRTVTETSVASDDPQAMASALHGLVTQLIDGLKNAFTVANDLNEQGIGNFIAGTIESLQKWEWQLRASAEGSVPKMSEESDEKQLAETKVDSDELAQLNEAIESLTLSNTSLKEENSKLKNSLHFMLAERVVDAKIAVGIVESDQRVESLKDHVTRSASSLADSIRDLEKYSRNYVKNVAVNTNNVELDIKAMATGPNASNEVLVGEELDNQSTEQTAESILVDVLMGRKKL